MLDPSQEQGHQYVIWRPNGLGHGYPHIRLVSNHFYLEPFGHSVVGSGQHWSRICSLLLDLGPHHILHQREYAPLQPLQPF